MPTIPRVYLTGNETRNALMQQGLSKRMANYALARGWYCPTHPPDYPQLDGPGGYATLDTPSASSSTSSSQK